MPRFYKPSLITMTLFLLSSFAIITNAKSGTFDITEQMVTIQLPDQNAQQVSLDNGVLQTEQSQGSDAGTPFTVSLNWQAAPLGTFLDFSQVSYKFTLPDGTVLAEGSKIFFEKAHLSSSNQIFTTIEEPLRETPQSMVLTLRILTSYCADDHAVCRDYINTNTGAPAPNYDIQTGRARLIIDFTRDVTEPPKDFQPDYLEPSKENSELLAEAFVESETMMVSFMKRQQTVKFDTIDTLVGMASSQSSSFNTARQSDDEKVENVASFQPYADFTDAGGVAEGKAQLGFAGKDGQSYTSLQTEVIYKELSNGDSSMSTMIVAQHDRVVSDHASVGVALGLTQSDTDISGTMSGDLTTEALSISPNISYQIPDVADLSGYLFYSVTDNKLSLSDATMDAVSKYDTDQFAGGITASRKIDYNDLDIKAIGGIDYAKYAGTDTIWSIRNEFASILQPSQLETAEKLSAKIGGSLNAQLTEVNSVKLSPMYVCSNIEVASVENDDCGHDIHAEFKHRIPNAGALRFSLGQKDNHGNQINKASLNMTIQF